MHIINCSCLFIFASLLPLQFWAFPFFFSLICCVVPTQIQNSSWNLWFVFFFHSGSLFLCLIFLFACDFVWCVWCGCEVVVKSLTFWGSLVICFCCIGLESEDGFSLLGIWGFLSIDLIWKRKMKDFSGTPGTVLGKVILDWIWASNREVIFDDFKLPKNV